ncbi:MAG TPA: branched-chain amino acid ABC transporter ATP-binding protein/permease [Acidimicrobiales bacterium]|nr:branched-chain amino acid ABC transporter ATP-binding protein/permease [Acidimicrobiales bacterium]
MTATSPPAAFRFAPHVGRLVGVPLACVALAIVLPLAGAAGVINQPDIDVFSYGVLAGMLALSLNIITGYAGPVSLGQVAFLGMGAFTTGLVATKLHLPLTLAFLVAVVGSTAVGALAALVVGLPALRLRGIYLALSTFAFADAVDHYFFNVQQLTGLGSGITVPRPHVLGINLHEASRYVVVPLIGLALVWMFDVRLRHGRLGRALVAIRENEDVAASFGVRVAWSKLAAFMASGAVAGFTGALFAYQVTVVNHSSFTFDQSLFYLIIVVVGGLGSRGGVLVAGMLFTALPRWLSFLQEWNLIVASLLLVITLARHPGGLPSMWAEARDRRALQKGQDDLDAVLPTMGRRRLAEDAQAGAAGESGRGARLQVEGVTVRFGGVVAVDGAGLEVGPGARVGLVGPNGAGKSTLFNVISGLVRPAAGRVLLDGVDLTALPPHERAARGMSRTFQQIGLVKDASLVENLLLAQHCGLPGGPAALFGSGPARRREKEALARAHELLTDIGLASYAEVRAGSLSGGQQRLVELACAIAPHPRLLLLDEPSAGLSPAAAEHLAEQLAALSASYSTSILLIEHHLPLVTAVCEECYVLDSGQVLAHGPTAKVLRQPEVAAAYLGETSP